LTPDCYLNAEKRKAADYGRGQRTQTADAREFGRTPLGACIPKTDLAHTRTPSFSLFLALIRAALRALGSATLSSAG